MVSSVELSNRISDIRFVRLPAIKYVRVLDKFILFQLETRK